MLMTGPFRIATKFGFRALAILNVVIYNPVLTNVSIPAWSQEDYRYYVLYYVAFVLLALLIGIRIRM